MSYRDQLITEINDKLDDLARDKQGWRAQWIAHAICDDHAAGLGKSDHREFWRYGAYEFTRKLVTECINRRAGPKAQRPDGKQQSLFPGFDREHLQDYYVVTRDGDEIGVFVGELSDDEIDAKAALYRSQAATCYAHADELDRFKKYRRSQQIVAA